MARIPRPDQFGLGGTGILPPREAVPSATFSNPGGVTPENFGAGVGRAAQDLAQGGRQLSDVLVQAATNDLIMANEREAKQLDISYSKRIRDLMYGDGTPENPGYYGLRGEAAVKARPEVMAALEEARTSIAGRAGNPKIAAMFNQASAARMDSELKVVGRHFQAQSVVANDNTHKARIKDFGDNAIAHYNDPEQRNRDIAAMRAEVETYQRDKGATQEVIDSKMQEALSLAHQGIVERILAGGDFTGAMAYYQAHEGEIDGPTQTDILNKIAQHTSATASGVKRTVRETIKSLRSGAVPDNLAETQAAVDAIPMNVDKSLDNLRLDLVDAVGDQAVVSAFNKKPIAEQGKVIAAFRARASSPDPNARLSLDESRQLRYLNESYNNNAREFAKGNGLQVAANNSIVPPLKPLDYRDLPAMLQRSHMADVASEAYGTTVLPLTQSDVTDFINQVTGEGSATPPALEDVSLMLANAQAAFGEDGAAFIVKDAIEKKHPELALALQVSNQRPKLAQDILRGQRFLLENPQYKPGDRDKLENSAAVFGNFFTKDTAQAQGDILAAADGLYAIRAQQNGAQDFDPQLYRETITDIMGGFVEHNGQQILPAYPDMTQDDMNRIMSALRNQDLMDSTGELPKTTNGHDFTVDMLQSSIWSSEAHLVSNSMNGTYQIMIPHLGYVLNSDGSAPYELNLRQIIDSGLQVPPGLQLPDSYLVGPGGAGTISTPETITPPEGLVTVPPQETAPVDIPLSVSKMFTASAEYNTKDGIPTKVYKDSGGVPTIGIGFNLNRPDAKQTIEAYGYNYDAVLAGKQEITPADATAIYQTQYEQARREATNIVPGFASLDRARQVVFTDMAFNLGADGLSGFHDMLAAVANKDWNLAAKAAKDSQWYKQVKNRGKRNVEVIRTGQIPGIN